jgi:hypothetical protein
VRNKHPGQFQKIICDSCQSGADEEVERPTPDREDKNDTMTAIHQFRVSLLQVLHSYSLPFPGHQYLDVAFT